MKSLMTFAVLAGMLTASASYAGSSFTIDTSPIAGQTGSLFFQFNPDTSDTLPLTASVTVSGITGSLATFTLDNSGSINSKAVTPYIFGSHLTFTPAFAVTPTPGADEGSTFLLSLLDSGGDAYATTDSADFLPAVISIHQGPTGVLDSPQLYSLTPVPESSTAITLALMLTGLGAITLVARRRVSAGS